MEQTPPPAPGEGYPVMTDEQKASVLLCLTGIAANGPTDTAGICSHVRKFTCGEIGSIYLCRYFARWPECSGTLAYPVDGGVDAHWATRDTRWDVSTEYGAKRYRLLAFLIHELTKELHYVS